MSDIDDCIDASELVDRCDWAGNLTREMKWEKIERARLELAALRAELDHERTLAMMALAMMEHLDTVNAPISEYESAWLVRTREITDAEQRRINAAEATRLLGLDQEAT